MAALAAAAALAGTGCQQKSEGVPQVLVIGDEPQLVDPRKGPLDTSDAVMITNAAQGLVRFDGHGQIVPGLGETWNVSDDGLSYIFRLANGTWPNGRKITAEQVARMLRRLIASSSDDPLKDAFGAVDDIVAMTDRVIEIRLNQPRPHLLQLLAQPEMGLVYEDQGTGPFSIDRDAKPEDRVRLVRQVSTLDEEESERERLDLGGAAARQAIAAFTAGKADLVLGGTFADLPVVPRDSLSRGALQFDPASGLFGLIPARDDGLIADPQVRQLLSRAIDREALIAAFDVPGLLPRVTILEPGLDNIADPVPPDWVATAIADRRPMLIAAARRILPASENSEQQDAEDGVTQPPVIRIALPDGPGADILLDRLTADWGVLGINVERAKNESEAELKLVDEVAPSSSAAWFLRHFRCKVAPVCDEQLDRLIEAARTTPVLAQRSALQAEAAQRIDSLQLFIPLAAPIRWSLVSARITGFAGNRFAVHTLTGLEERLNQTGE
ncbi:MAG TPA: ABC transporter substrate-binding protein [Sphingomicrobium sp.]|nr:ABC transporter substrate-binding protein [Sphingomicrobium sp.]